MPKLHVFAVLLVVFGNRAAAQNPLPIGPQTQVSSYTSGTQIEPAVAVTPSGRFMVVWEGYDPAVEDGDIFGRIVDADGQPVAADFCLPLGTT